MDMKNQQVTHTVFGTGSILRSDDRHLTVAFPEHGEKLFVYPDAFEKFLTMSDPTLAVQVKGDLDAKLAAIEVERLHQVRLREEEIQRNLAEQARLLTVKTPARRSTKS